jgi:small-conductance mechanosensitive channel
VSVIADHADPFTVEWLRSHGLAILIIVAAAVLLSWLAGVAVRRLRRRLEAAESQTAEIGLRRTLTLTNTVSYAARIVIWTMAFLLILDQFNVNLAPLLAGAGVAGIALGFGAQSLVRDFLSGFFILSENQFGVGDVVEVSSPAGKVTGSVESVTLRTTSLRAFDGTQHVIPNGNILTIGNRSRGWARAIVDVQIGYEADVEEARRVLEELFDELRADPELSGSFIEGPRVLGVENLTDFAVVLRVVAETRPSRKPDVERQLRTRIKQRFDEAEIQNPVIPPTMRREAGGDGNQGPSH